MHSLYPPAQGTALLWGEGKIKAPANLIPFALHRVITLQRKIAPPLTIWSLTPASSTETQEEFSQPLASFC